MQNIQIDWDIHKKIEAERRGFDEAPYLALRRLLGLPDVAPSHGDDVKIGSGLPWSEDEVVVPHGSLARMEYLRGTQVFEGQFLNGHLVVNGQKFDTLSAAASALAVTKNGDKTSLNGWNYWHVKFPGEKKWRALWEIRRERKGA